MNVQYLSIQDYLDHSGHTLPIEWKGLEKEWSAARASNQACEYIVDDYGRWKLAELIEFYRSGPISPDHVTSLANDLVNENDVLLILLDVIGAMTEDPSSLTYFSDNLLRIVRHSKTANDLPHTHLLRFIEEAAVFLETRLGSGDLTLAETRADVLARRRFMEMVANVLWAAEPERRAA